MGVLSTIKVTRTKAKQALIERITADIPDRELELLLDVIVEKDYFNTMVVDDGVENQDWKLD